MRLVGTAAVITALALLAFVSEVLQHKPNRLDYRGLHIDPARLPVAAVVPAVLADARGWKPDAAWWALSLHGVHGDGTIDLVSGGRARVVFISPSRVQTFDPKRRADALRRYVFGRQAIGTSGAIGVPTRWKSVYLPPPPRCSVRRLVRALRPLGLSGRRSVDVSFDPKHAYGPDAPAELSWHVRSDHPALNGWFSMASCRLVRAVTPGRS